LVVWLHDQGFICPKTTFVHRGGVCSGPSYLKCLGCAKDQYGTARSFALTSGMQLMRPWRGRADRYVANSRATARASAGHIGPADDVLEVIPPFVPEEAFHAWARPRPTFVPGEADYLMFAGALGAHKGVDVLLRAWAQLDPRLPLVMAGIRRFDSPRRVPDGVVLAEEVPHEDVLAAWGHCAAAVVPSVWPEPFGAVALEAMAAGKPVVASAIEGLSELVVDGSTGILVPPGDVDALRRAMQALVDDPPLRARMGACGQARAKTFTAEIVASAWERVFEEVVHGD
jgi:glycosyltransferase involved in cell wall biosynthesis